MDVRASEANELHQLSLQYVEKMEVMIENNERLLDIMSGGQLYGYKERTLNETNQISATKRVAKQQVRQGGAG